MATTKNRDERMSDLTSDNLLHLDAYLMAKIGALAPSPERVDAMAAQMREVEPDPAPLDTPLPRPKFALVVGINAGYGERLASFPEDTGYEVIEAVTPSEIRARLEEERKPEILHIACHGDLHGHNILIDTPALELDSRDTITAADLISTLHIEGVQLVVLCACQTAAIQEMPSTAPIARALTEAGVPAVVAMREATDDAVCDAMVKAFYSALARGKTIRSAAYVARKAAYNEGADREPLILYERTALGCRKAAFPRARAPAPG